jgi:uncharacterized protein YgbK (DUF1537 family)
VVTDFARARTLQSLVLVIDTETRHIPAEEAAARTKRATGLARSRCVPLVYKKTDSTLRGNIGAEFRAIQEVFPHARIVYAPAYPDLGRRVKDGQLFVHGKPVHETGFANDLLSPVRDCRIRNVIGDVQALILDGECNGDIDAAARMILEAVPPRICAGPAALAGSLAQLIGSPAGRIEFPPVSRCLVVNGSMHPASIQQMNVAKEHGIFDDHWKALGETMDGSGSERALLVGEYVRRILSSEDFDAVIVFGGDTAFGIHRALGSAPFEAIGEIAPGVAVSRSDDLLWITKAGGFGAPDILATIRRRLT